MTDSTLDMLTKNVEYVADTIAEYARQIEAGEYGNRYTVTDEDGNEITTRAQNEDDALALVQASPGNLVGELDDWTVERDEFDVPTIVDEYGNEESIDDWPLAVVVKIGQPLAVQLTVGGPHIEIVQDLSNGSAMLAGYWGGEKVYRYGSEFQTVLDYFTDALWDEAPEEYK